ncbi:hypothetical protein AQUCO_00500487v1 [Aquilegia coerulea]|uniref:RING-type domain-containing protein n=1 Tax=Aquilegia coerulea TaxID=218851 RepID=A0A2G5ES62_AQUCA|nr:hypothetical protein AQUCO_00500487v1 [Aquilegia coerulea]
MYVLLLVVGLTIGGGVLICVIASLREMMQANDVLVFQANREREQGQAILDRIQDFVFHSQTPEDLPFGSEDCPICLDAWEEGQRILVIPSCHHMYHLDCIRPLILQRSRCPVCRRQISLEDGAVADENERDCNV